MDFSLPVTSFLVVCFVSLQQRFAPWLLWFSCKWPTIVFNTSDFPWFILNFGYTSTDPNPIFTFFCQLYCFLPKEISYLVLCLDFSLSSSQLILNDKLRLKYSKISSFIDLAFEDEVLELLLILEFIVNIFFYNDIDA